MGAVDDVKNLGKLKYDIKKSNDKINSDCNKETEECEFDEFIKDKVQARQCLSPLSRQIILGLVTLLNASCSGLVLGYSTILIAQLKLDGSPIKTDIKTESWIGSMVPLSMILTSMTSSSFTDRIGRKMSAHVAFLLVTSGFTILSIANNLNLILLGRFLCGMGPGLGSPVFAVFVSETSPPKYRGLLLALATSFLPIGIFLGHILGTFLHYKTVALICIAFSALGIVLLSFLSESPVWLISKNRTKKAIESYFLYRGIENRYELKEMLETYSEKTKYKFKFSDLKLPSFYKPLNVVGFYFFVSQFSGYNAITTYTVDIMKSTLGGNINEYVAMLIVDFIRSVTSLLSLIPFRYCGRRALCFISGTLSSVSVLGLSLYTHFSKTYDLSSISYVPLILYSTYVSGISFGVFPLPWFMCGEILPAKARGLLSGVCSTLCFSNFFIVVISSPYLMNTIGYDGTYLLYGSVLGFGTLILFFILPETKGRTLIDIEKEFNKT